MMMQQQELENQKLKEALEGLNTNSGAANEFDNIINGTSQELADLKNSILPGGGNLANGFSGEEEDPFP